LASELFPLQQSIVPLVFFIEDFPAFDISQLPLLIIGQSPDILAFFAVHSFESILQSDFIEAFVAAVQQDDLEEPFAAFSSLPSASARADMKRIAIERTTTSRSFIRRSFYRKMSNIRMKMNTILQFTKYRALNATLLI
jgi:hypothetical protein